MYYGNDNSGLSSTPQVFTGAGSASFTLSNPGSKLNNAEVFINKVLQVNNYSIVSNTLTFDTVVPNGYEVVVVPRNALGRQDVTNYKQPMADQSGSSTTAYTATYAPINSSLAHNTILGMKVLYSNSIINPTFSPDGLPARVIISIDGTPLSISQLLVGSTAQLRYDSILDTWCLINYPSSYGTTAPQFDNSTRIATDIFVNRAIANPLNTAANLTWDSSTDTYTGNTLGVSTVTNTHLGMRRCVQRQNGSIAYYLDPANSLLKVGGGASVLTGADGNVMVEIPAFYVQYALVGTKHTWAISSVPREGFAIHPAFVKGGIQVPYRYYSAYDACVNTTGSTYQSGLNYDANFGAGQNWTTAMRLASVSGVYPAMACTQGEFRTMAGVNGPGWTIGDFYLISAIQLLYLIEYQSFKSQTLTGMGNTQVAAGYPASSANQTDSPHSIAGKSNSIGNATGYVDSVSRDTAWMSYRGIENFYGNTDNWSDGINVLSGIPYLSNDWRTYADNVSTGYTKVYTQLPAVAGYGVDLVPYQYGFLVSNTTGGSTTTYLTDYLWTTVSLNCVGLFGGCANMGAAAGAFAWYLAGISSDMGRNNGVRLAF